MASKKIIYGIGALGTVAVTTTAIAVPLSLKKSSKKSAYDSLLTGTKLTANQLTELKKETVLNNSAAGVIKKALIDKDKLIVEYEKNSVKTIVVFKLSTNKLLTIASSLPKDKKYVVSYETSTPKVIQLPKGSKDSDILTAANSFKTDADTAITASPAALAAIKANTKINPQPSSTSTPGTSSGSGSTTATTQTTTAPAATFKWPTGTTENGLWKFNNEYYTSKAQALAAAGYSAVNSGFAKGNKYSATLQDIQGVNSSPTFPVSGSITVDGVTYAYHDKQTGGQLTNSAWFKSTESVTAASDTPADAIEAKVFKDKDSGKYYETENRAIDGAGYDQQALANGAKSFNLDATTYNKKEGVNAPGYAVGTATWNDGTNDGTPSVSSAANGWTIEISGTKYYKIKKDERKEVTVGWYPTAADVTGTVAPGPQASDADVLSAAQGSAPTGFKYVDTTGVKTQVHAVTVGWYPTAADVTGTVAPGPQASDADVLSAAQTSPPTGFKYVATQVDAEDAKDEWNTLQDGTGTKKTNKQIDDLIKGITTDQEKIKINDGSTETTWTYNDVGTSGASGYSAGNPGFYTQGNNTTKFDISTLATDYYTKKSGPNSQKHFKSKEEIVEEYTIPTDGSVTTITINDASNGDVTWNWKTNYDGSDLSNNNKGFYTGQPHDDTGTDKLDTSTIKYEYNNKYFTTNAFALLEAAVKNDGWEDANSGYKKQNDYAATLADAAIDTNQSLPTSAQGLTVTIDGAVVTAEQVNPPANSSTPATTSPSLIYNIN